MDGGEFPLYAEKDRGDHYLNDIGSDLSVQFAQAHCMHSWFNCYDNKRSFVSRGTAILGH